MEGSTENSNLFFPAYLQHYYENLPDFPLGTEQRTSAPSSITGRAKCLVTSPNRVLLEHKAPHAPSQAEGRKLCTVQFAENDPIIYHSPAALFLFIKGQMSSIN